MDQSKSKVIFLYSSCLFLYVAGNMQKKPGLPPNKVFSGNNKRGRGRGRGAGPAGQFGGTMAPVHSLSKVQG